MITEIYAWTQVNEHGQEVIIGRMAGDLALAAADSVLDDVKQFKGLAQSHADFKQKPVQLVKFTARENILSINPTKKPI